MKKYLISILSLLILLAAQGVGTAAAAGGKSLAFLGVSQTDRGPVFTFRVSGNFSKGELKGSVHVENGGDYILHCTQVDDDTVKCSASQKVSNVNVSVTFGGSTFWTYVPGIKQSTSSSSQYCYGVWDYWAFTDFEWTDFGPHCQDTPAQEGDELWYTVPDPEGSFEAPVWFFENPTVCEDIPNHGSAYYWDDCLELQ